MSGSQEFNYIARQQSSIPGEVSSSPRPEGPVSVGPVLTGPTIEEIITSVSIFTVGVLLSRANIFETWTEVKVPMIVTCRRMQNLFSTFE